MRPISRLLGQLGTGDGAATGPMERRTSRRAARFTPSASQAGDATEPSRQAEPPSYAASVGHDSSRHVAAGAPANGDNKIQVDDGLIDDESSELDTDDSDLTLDDLVDDDEAAWALDEYTASHEPPSYEDATNVPSEDDLVREIIAGQQRHAHAQLPCPVIIPQRRPRNRSRGFVRAYAPVLQNVGIDQVTFLKFLTSLHKSSQANPWFTVIEVSHDTAEAAGSAAGYAVEAAVKVAIAASKDREDAQRTNKFLDRMNTELFRPAGCFAFVMKYKKETNLDQIDSGFFGVMAANINLATNQVEVKHDGDGITGLTNKMQLFRIASDPDAASDLASSAPLIFPEIDDEMARTGTGSLLDKSRDAQKLLQDYLSRRALIKYTGNTEEVPAAQPPGSSGGIVGLLTGGYTMLSNTLSQGREHRSEQRANRRQDRQEARHERRLDRHQRRLDRGVRRFEKRHGKSPTSALLSTAGDARAMQPVANQHSSRRRRHRRRGTVGKVLNEDVLYLMIVNVPL